MYQLSHQGILLGLKYKLKLKMLVIKFMVAMEGQRPWEGVWFLTEKAEKPEKVVGKQESNAAFLV